MPVSDYFTQLKGLWDEFLNYRPILGCTCGAKCICGLSRILMDYQHYDYVHSFLMGLIDSFAPIRGQILLMEPLPNINKVFSLIQNDEKQRGAGLLPLPIGFPTVDSTTLLSRLDNGPNTTFSYPNTTPNAFSYPNTAPNAFFTRTDNNKQYYQYPKKDKPPYICSHYGFKGHIADKCYKLHGHPPGFCSKGKYIAVANQVSSSAVPSSDSTDNAQSIPNLATVSVQCPTVAQYADCSDTTSQFCIRFTQPSSCHFNFSHTTSFQYGRYTNLSFNFSKPNLDHFVFSDKLL